MANTTQATPEKSTSLDMFLSRLVFDNWKLILAVLSTLVAAGYLSVPATRGEVAALSAKMDAQHALLRERFNTIDAHFQGIEQRMAQATVIRQEIFAILGRLETAALQNNQAKIVQLPVEALSDISTVVVTTPAKAKVKPKARSHTSPAKSPVKKIEIPQSVAPHTVQPSEGSTYLN